MAPKHGRGTAAGVAKIATRTGSVATLFDDSDPRWLAVNREPSAFAASTLLGSVALSRRLEVARSRHALSYGFRPGFTSRRRPRLHAERDRTGSADVCDSQPCKSRITMGSVGCAPRGAAAAGANETGARIAARLAPGPRYFQPRGLRASDCRSPVSPAEEAVLERWQRLRQRTDVRAEVERIGNLGSYPIYDW